MTGRAAPAGRAARLGFGALLIASAPLPACGRIELGSYGPRDGPATTTTSARVDGPPEPIIPPDRDLGGEAPGAGAPGAEGGPVYVYGAAMDGAAMADSERATGAPNPNAASPRDDAGAFDAGGAARTAEFQ